MPVSSETNDGSTHSGLLSVAEVQNIFSSLQGGKRASKVPHFLAVGHVSMEAKPQSKDLSHQVPSASLAICEGLQLEGC